MNDQVSQEAPEVELTPEDIKRLKEGREQEATEVDGDEDWD